MNTNKWGPGLWVGFHAMCFNYPKEPSAEDKSRYRRYYHLLGDMLPCRYCRDSYKQFVKDIPIERYYNSREGLIYWSYRIHDRVNQKLGKKSIPFVEYVHFYEDMRAKCGKRAVSTGGVTGGCIEPLKNFGSDDEITQYANRIWDKYHNGDYVGCPVAAASTMDGAGNTRTTVALSVAALVWIGSALALLR